MTQITNKELYQELNELRKELEQDDKAIEAKMAGLENKIDKTYTKLVQFQPVQRLVYGLVSLILVGFISSLLFLIGWSVR